jgi:hypothetical protein
MPTRRLALALALSLPLLPACGGEAKKEEPAPAKAAEEPKKEDDAIAKRRADREAKAKAEKEAEEARLAAVDKLAVLPAKMPKDIKKACDAVADAQLKFFEKMYSGPELDKLKAAQGTQRPMTLSQCTSTGSLEAAACQANALTTAEGPELKTSISDIMRVCLEKFAKPAG